MKLVIIFILFAINFNNQSFSAGSYDNNKDYGKDFKDTINLIKSEDYKRAIKKLKMLINQNSPNFTNADLYNYIGFSYRKLKEYKNAEKFYLKALKINNNHIGALEYIGELYIETDRINLAEDILDKLNKASGQKSDEYQELLNLINTYKKK